MRAVIRTAGGREVILGDLHAGAIFGEMAAIDEAPRSASIGVLNRAVVARLSGRASSSSRRSRRSWRGG